jgi:hypothetical protein
MTDRGSLSEDHESVGRARAASLRRARRSCMRLRRSRLLSAPVAALALLLAAPASALEDRVVRHEDTPPSVRTLHPKPIPAFGKRQVSSPFSNAIGVSRGGDVFVLTSGERFAIYDPIADALRDVPLEIPEGLRGLAAAFFSFDPEGGVHVCFVPPGGRPVTLVSFDGKGRISRSRTLPVSPFMASGAVAPSGDLFLSTLSPQRIAGGRGAAFAPVAPVLVFDKDGALKGAVGTWDEVEGNAAEVALRNLRIVRTTPEGHVVLFRKDRYEFEVLDRNGVRVRRVTVAARDHRKPHLYADPVKEEPAPSPTPAPTRTKVEAPMPAADAGGPETLAIPIRGRPRRFAREPRERPSLSTSPASSAASRFRVTGVFILRNPYSWGGKDPRPVIDVFDSFGRWEEQLQLESRDRFDDLAVARDGTIYLTSGLSEHHLWSADLHEQPAPAPPAGAAHR